MIPALRIASLVLLASAAGCAATPAPRSSAPAPVAVDEGWTTPRAAEAPSQEAPAARRLSLVAAGPITLSRPKTAPTRPPRAGRADVRFVEADLPNALQLLADAGRFNLVLESGLGGRVSAILKGVDPYDALVALAEANGATVRYENGIAVVRKR